MRHAHARRPRLMAFGLAMVSLGGMAGIAGGPFPAVALLGNDYAFVQLPDPIAAGPTLFSFESRGRGRHEMSRVLLRAGVTMQQVMARPQAISGRAFTDSLVGLLVARPAESSGGQLFVDLHPGRR